MCTGDPFLHLVCLGPPQPRRPAASVRSGAAAAGTEVPAARAPAECWERACAEEQSARAPPAPPTHPWRGFGTLSHSAHALEPSLVIIGSRGEGAEPPGRPGRDVSMETTHRGCFKICVHAVLSAGSSLSGLPASVLIRACHLSILQLCIWLVLQVSPSPKDHVSDPLLYSSQALFVDYPNQHPAQLPAPNEDEALHEYQQNPVNQLNTLF